MSNGSFCNSTSIQNYSIQLLINIYWCFTCWYSGNKQCNSNALTLPEVHLWTSRCIVSHPANSILHWKRNSCYSWRCYHITIRPCVSEKETTMERCNVTLLQQLYSSSSHWLNYTLTAVFIDKTNTFSKSRVLTAHACCPSSTCQSTWHPADLES